MFLTYLRRLLDGNAREEETKESLREERLLSENAAQWARMNEKKRIAKNSHFTSIIFPNIMLTYILWLIETVLFKVQIERLI